MWSELNKNHLVYMKIVWFVQIPFEMYADTVGWRLLFHCPQTRPRTDTMSVLRVHVGDALR